MVIERDSVEEKGHGEEWDLPQSPGADYGLTDDFDPAKYDFYNPITRGAGSGLLAKQSSLVSSNRDEENCGVTDNHDEGSPEPLSPIEELDDDVRSLQFQRQGTESPPPASFQDEHPRHEMENNIINSGHIGFEQHTRGLSLIELRTESLFSRKHLQVILADRVLAIKFIKFLRTYRPDSFSILKYYLGAVNALKALRYAKSILDSLEVIPSQSFTQEISSATMVWVVEDKIARTLDVLVKEDIPAFIAYTYAETIDLALTRKMSGRQDSTPQTVPDGLAEAFILSDPARPDNPIVFTSEGFHSLTGYCRKDILGRNCRILSGKNTNPHSRKRFKSSLDAGREHCEVLLNYRRDGSSFVNMVMCVPLRDKTSRVRYYLGAQLDVTEFVNNYTGFSSLRRVVESEEDHSNGILGSGITSDGSAVGDFAQLTEVFTTQEFEGLASLKRHEQVGSVLSSFNTEKSFDSSSPTLSDSSTGGIIPALGFYQNYLLARPHPSLRVLFTSPGLQSLGILQTPLLDNIGGSSRVRQDLFRALEMGRKVTAKVQWLSRSSNATYCWLHCTPLLGVNDSIGAWIIILVDVHPGDEISRDSRRAPHVRAGTFSGENCAADPTPWDKTRKPTLPSQETIALRYPVEPNVQGTKNGFQVTSNGTKSGPTQNVQDPATLKAGFGLPDEANGQYSNRILKDNRAANDDELPTIGQKPGNGSAVPQILPHNEKSSGKSGRSMSTGSYKAPSQSLPERAFKTASRSSDERTVGKPAPIKLPGPSSLGDDTKGSLAVRKRTYKSLSPYGIIFDE